MMAYEFVELTHDELMQVDGGGWIRFCGHLAIEIICFLLGIQQTNMRNQCCKTCMLLANLFGSIAAEVLIIRDIESLCVASYFYDTYYSINNYTSVAKLLSGQRLGG